MTRPPRHWECGVRRCIRKRIYVRKGQYWMAIGYLGTRCKKLMLDDEVQRRIRENDILVAARNRDIPILSVKASE
jgi:hypothetical protein